MAVLSASAVFVLSEARVFHSVVNLVLPGWFQNTMPLMVFARSSAVGVV